MRIVFRERMGTLPLYFRYTDRPRRYGLVAALNDSPIHPALQLIHAHFAQNWSLDPLAYEIGLSRTTFATPLRERIGMVPLRYITTWRMQPAKELLETTTRPLLK